MTGHGGWPMTVVLDHDGNPFFAGTYFPDRARGGMPAFRQVLEAVARGLDGPARRRTSGGRGPARPPAALGVTEVRSAPIDAAVLDAAVARLWTERDDLHGGLRRCAEVPAVDGARGAAAPRVADGLARGRGRWWTRPARRWPAAGCTTSWAAASRATPSTARGWCRTSRRCSTTTRCCWASTPGGAPRWGSASPRRRRTSWCASSAPPRAASRPRSTPTPRARRGASTSGRRPS